MLILRWLINALVLILISQLIPGFIVTSFYSALIAALLLGLVNATIRPILLILTIPINIITLGLFTFVINAVMLLLVSTVVKGFSITSFSSALLGGLILWLVSLLVNYTIRDARKYRIT